MRPLSMLLAMALAVAALPGAAQDDKFLSLDKNRDGFLSAEEFAASGEFDRSAFDKADENRDGKLSPSEFLRARTADRPKREGKSAAIVEDVLITTKVKAALLKEPNLKSVDVNVDTENGRVTLTGRVQSAADRARVLQIASSVEGVTGVKDALSVR
jgi:BON domain-containing protein/EF hand domain-containing protein